VNGPSERMLELLSVLQSGRSWPGGELAERIGTSPRTLRRDLDRLRELGYPVESMRGPGGSYRLVAGRAMPPLLLTDDEAVAVAVGLRVAASAQDDGAATSALRKLEQVLPSALRYRMEAVSASTEAASRGMLALDLTVLRRLSTAAYARQDVRFSYTNRSGADSSRRVEPYRQVLLGRRWYLLGWDLDRADWRTFRLDRIAGLTVPGTTFRPRELPADGAASFVQTAARPRDSSRQGVVRFGAPTEVVSERLVAEAGSLTAIDDHNCRYVTAAESWDWLAVTLAAVGVPYTIEGPPELLAHSRDLAARVAAATHSP
jgi:predicted DNA-binding transcriptional regulator YafY